MAINFSNTNSVWASVLAETLHRLGLNTAIICPGSRSTPLAMAFAQHPQIEAIPILDERSASFFALGRARKTQLPVVLVCTSGTAGANFYPAVIEAREGRVPLLVLTSDRPPELRDCNAGQTIDQQKLFGSYPNWYSELAVPSLDLLLLAYLRQTLISAWERTLAPVAGVVHLNLPFRDPLAPILQPEAQILAEQFPANFFEFEFSQPRWRTELPGAGQVSALANLALANPAVAALPQAWFHRERGLLIAG
ncbi:MAG: 2-succinyl-5-enolpyruvyl-6-hydroxy-3-cyclohexene-1-carboxylic-acid synthase, partial [Leptolyngbyaceae cyanobacterium CRU_2_3]|nr:2-succinyl-5-enolpyruvyl-6-hydroxy-3-cyclohexene-1-carboxylic-acid synthase [Leptolyngbyaceae cyanobacterium CRU_2_3]